MAEPVIPAGEGSYFPWADLQSTGLLWLVNRCVFHPRGFALALVYPRGATAQSIAEGRTQPIGWALKGDGREQFTFDLPEGSEQAAFDAVERLLEQGRSTSMAALASARADELKAAADGRSTLSP